MERKKRTVYGRAMGNVLKRISAVRQCAWLMTVLFQIQWSKWGWDVAQLVEHQTVTPLTQVRLPDAARDFSPGVNFQRRLSCGVHTPPCAIACINICAHVKDPVVHVRVRWIMEVLKQPACTVGWVARLCRSWLSPGKNNPNFPWEKSHRVG